MDHPRLPRLARYALGAVALLAACGPDTTSGPPLSETSSTPAIAAATLTPVEGRYIVVMRPGQPEGLTTAARAAGVQLEEYHPRAGIAMVRDLDRTQLAALAAAPGVVQVVQDMSTQWVPSPSQFVTRVQVLDNPGPVAQGTDQSGAAFFNTYQWNMKVTQANLAWTGTTGGAGKLVCVLDTGVDPGHLDLAGKVDLAASMVAAEPFVEDLHFHGTFVSALVSSRGIGIASTAPDARLCAVKVLGASGSGSFGDIINGIIFAAANGADVINMSLGAYLDREAPGVSGLLAALQQAINIANDAGVLVVTSSGNEAINLDEDAPNLIKVPAQLNRLLSVGATAPINQANFDLITSYSNIGGRTGLHLVAPGGDLVTGGVLPDLVLSACSRYAIGFNCAAGNVYLFGAGTSFASPMVAGAGAVVSSNLGIASPGVLANCITSNTDNVGNPKIYGRGRLNVLKAASCGSI